MNDGELKSNNGGFFQSPKLISLVLLFVFLVGLSAGAILSGTDLISNSEERNFNISADNEVGTNRFILTEIDEGDNDEEVVTEHILHDFVFQATDRGGLVTWDFGDGFTATGVETTHQFQDPGIYTVKASETLDGKVTTTSISITVHLETEAEVDNMECVCAPTAKDTIIPLSNYEGTSTLEGFVRVEHDGSSESCSLRNPLQECHVRVILQRLSGGDVVEESVLFDETFRSNEKVVDFSFESIELDEGDRLQLRLETDQIRDWHKPTAEWLTSAPIEN
ncbi:MAG: PKD domain-containing protein [Candidatus Thalassarchaeaceae archaeon]